MGVCAFRLGNGKQVPRSAAIFGYLAPDHRVPICGVGEVRGFVGVQARGQQRGESGNHQVRARNDAGCRPQWEEAHEFGDSGEVPDGDYTVPFGKAAIARAGNDVTVVAIGSMLKPALSAAEKLQSAGIGVEVIDPRTLVPLDAETIVRSVRKTGRAVIVDEARDRCSAASHIAAIIADKAFSSLKGPVKRVTVPDVSMPYAPNAESRVLPSENQIVQTATDLVRSKQFA